jgi:cyclopropane fatty-acyl-phospholipid synthase-like methyltransferase
MDKHLHTVNIYNRHVREYVEKFMDLHLYKDTFDQFLEQLPLYANVLELGCGPGNVVKYLKTKRTDLEILGIDLAPEMIKEAQIQNPDAAFRLMDMRDAHELKQEFTAVVAAFCLPYISYDDVHTVFRNICNISTKNTVLYISCMEGSTNRSGWEQTSFTGEDEMYINYYERTELAGWLKDHQFDIIAFYTRDYPETDGSTTTDIIFLAKRSDDV